MGKWAEQVFSKFLGGTKHMSGRMTWRDVYKEFRIFYPRLKQEVIDFKPYDYAQIKLFFKDGKRAIYDTNTKQCKFIVE